VLLNGRESRVRFDHVEVEQRGETGQGEDTIGFDDRITLRTDLPIAHRLPDETFDLCTPLPQPDADLLTQQGIVHRLQHVGRVHPTGGTGIGTERKPFGDDDTQHLARMRGLTERLQGPPDAQRALLRGELHREGQHRGSRREVVLQLPQRDPCFPSDLAHGRSRPALLVDDPPQRMGNRLASLVMIHLLRHPPHRLSSTSDIIQVT